jgi:hypothetical protein
MSKKKRTQLLTAVGLLILLLLALLGVSLANQAADQAQEEADAAAVIYLPLGETPVELAFTGTDGTALDFVSNDGVWACAADADFPLSQTTVESIASTLEGMTATKSFSPGEELSSYGLEEPTHRLTLTDANGTQTTLLLGDSAPDGSSYAMVEGAEDTLYTVSSTLGTQLEVGLLDCAQLPTWPDISEENLLSATITGAGGTTTITVEGQEVTTEADADSSDTEPEVTTEYHWFADGTDATEDSLMAALQSEMTGVSVSSMVAYNPAEGLEAYGLDTPWAELVVTYTDDSGAEATATLTVGGVDSDGNYYCLVDGDERAVYLCDTDKADSIVLCAALGYQQAQSSDAVE